MTEHLLLKWGTLKGWHLERAESMECLRRYADGGVSLSAMAQADSPEQKQAICDLIDTVEGEIINDWSGEKLSKDAAKKYIREYRQ